MRFFDRLAAWSWVVGMVITGILLAASVCSFSWGLPGDRWERPSSVWP